MYVVPVKKYVIKPKKYWQYVKVLFEANIVFVEDDTMGMAGWVNGDIAIYLDHPGIRDDYKELQRVITHELVHNAHPAPMEWISEDVEHEKLRLAWEAQIEKIEEHLWSLPEWRALLDQWLLGQYHRMVRFARDKGINFS
jgi:hypothetical protein